MKTKLKQIKFTDTGLDGKKYLGKKNGEPYWMLHIQLADGRWMGRFYGDASQDPSTKIQTNKEYEVSFKQTGPYYNLVGIYEILPNGIVSQLV